LEHGTKTVLVIQDLDRLKVQPSAAELACTNAGKMGNLDVGVNNSDEEEYYRDKSILFDAITP
jgi:hypothetical protein